MDAADRAELDRLRRLVYGPGGDAPPAAAERLAALEDALHVELDTSERTDDRALAQPAPEADEPTDARESTRVFGEATSVGGEPTGRGSLLRTVLVLVAVVVGVLAAFRLMAELPRPEPEAQTEVVSTRDAWTLARDPDAVVIERIPVGSAAEEPADAPWFPTSGTVVEATHVATLYGWEVWTAEADGIIQRESCLSVRRAPIVRGRCVPAVLRSTNVLAVDLAYSDIAATLRPPGMTDDQRVGFWRAGDSGIWVMLAAEPPLP